ncbi:MAG: group II truncated hemoglobin [Porticoccus sp.]|nr:group II truncated hemoglobin [Porticoccus sp.]MBQ0807465.1 group II truncated hemoglobin [Porticoccus sp.]
MQFNEHGYGREANSYITVGELSGITALVDDFYSNMEVFPEAEKIRAMHPQDLTESRKKLTYFLSGWLGGPKLYAEHYGGINIPGVHQHLSVGDEERDAWLLCMKSAIAAQDYDVSFKEYLISQLKIPAERIKQVCTRSA